MSSPDPHIHPFAFADPVLTHLERHVAGSAEFHRLIETSVLRQIDSALLVEDRFVPFRAPPRAAAQIPIPDFPVTNTIEDEITAVRRNGLGPHLARLTGLFGHIMLNLSGSHEQIEAVRRWSASGARGAFFMTDRGGPSLQQWRTVIHAQTKDRWHLHVDKIWAIGAAECDFAIVIAARPGAMAPTALLIDPDSCSMLTRHATGLPFLDGHVQLGSAQGDIHVPADSALARGGLIAVKQFLTLVRPRFVCALMAHLDWLTARGRMKPDDAQQQIAVHLTELAVAMRQATTLTRHSEDEVMALKFASNALLFDLVESGAVHESGDARDLLAMTKMEGSSYRCFHELYMRGKGVRA